MAQSRRMGVPGSEMHVRFVDAAEAVLTKEGYHAISARRVAAEAGLKTQLLYYYFRTMDDLLLAVVRRVNEKRNEAFENAIASDEPLRALWEMNVDPSQAALAAELTSVANHREAVRNEIVHSATNFRRRQTDTIIGLLRAAGTGEEEAAATVMIGAALARTLVVESSLGLNQGHAEARKMVDRLIEKYSKALTG